ncbi:MAG: HD-GYP domain-containing protein [Chloroflexi bacterium]|nr:HD-GYP domain-containing protein [Chloroflexota bacterium]MDA1002282.1 HD-GYP domain-containing protein [Chloroflexota bacterium]
MNRTLSLGGWLLYAAVPAAVFAGLRLSSGWSHTLPLAESYFYIVTALAFGAAVLAVIAVIVATGLADYRSFVAGLSLLAIAGLYGAHGLATPGFIVPGEATTAATFAARAGLFLPAALLAFAAFRPPAALRARVVRGAAVVLASFVAVLAAFVAGALAFPTALPAALAGEGQHLVLLIATSGLAAAAAYRFAFDRGQDGRAPSGALVAAALLLLQAQLSEYFAPTWSVAWWLYHGQLLAGFAALFWVVLAEYMRNAMRAAAAPAPAPLSDTSQLTESNYEGVVRGFANSVEARGGYTPDHGRRVAILSVFIGLELRLPADHLHAIARGALLRDVGKISVPDAILDKPEQLTAEEYDVIRQHPAHGEAMLGEHFTGSVERAIIRHHHEWFDGTGYPDQLGADAIPLEARIVAVADVYDALRSDRSFRRAWTPDVARELMRAESGSHFDPRCIDAFLGVVDHFEEQFARADVEGTTEEQLSRIIEARAA